MRYAEYLPDPRLALGVSCYWVFESAASAGEVRDECVVPDGHPELIFHTGQAFSEVAKTCTGAEAIRAQPPSLFAGQITQPLLLRPQGSVAMISVRFTPWGAGLFLGMPMEQTTGQRIAADLLPDRWLDRVEGEIGRCTNDRQRIALIEGALLARLPSTLAGADALAIYCARALSQPRRTIGIADLVAQSGVSERQLERRFRQAIGMSPRLFASIRRFRALFDALNAEQPAPWLSAAIDAGYFDQPHMIRDFRRFAGQPPQAFMRSLSGLSAAMVNGAAAH